MSILNKSNILSDQDLIAQAVRTSNWKLLPKIANSCKLSEVKNKLFEGSEFACLYINGNIELIEYADFFFKGYSIQFKLKTCITWTRNYHLTKYWRPSHNSTYVELPKGTIKKITSDNLSKDI